MLSGHNALFVSTCYKLCRTSSVMIVKLEILEFVRTGTYGVGRSGSGTDILLEKKDEGHLCLVLAFGGYRSI